MCQVELVKEIKKRTQVWSLSSGQPCLQTGGFPVSYVQQSSGYFAKCFSEAPCRKATSKNFPDHKEASVFLPALAQSWVAWVWALISTN